MPSEAKKDFNAMLADSRGMPRIQAVTDPKTAARYGGTQMLLAPPRAYDEVMKRIPEGKLLTLPELREYLARVHGADFTDPMTAGIFVQIAAWASEQREGSPTPWWRVLKAGGELNPKCPGGAEAQKAKLEAEGHTVLQKGRTALKYYVKDYESCLFTPTV